MKGVSYPKFIDSSSTNNIWPYLCVMKLILLVSSKYFLRVLIKFKVLKHLLTIILFNPWRRWHTLNNHIVAIFFEE